MILLTLRDLRHRAVRFVVVTLLGALVFSLLFVMTGLVEQFNREPFLTVDAFGAETWIVPDGVSGPFTAAAALPVPLADAVQADDTAPAVISRSSLLHGSDREEVILIGHEAGGLGSPPTTEGRAVSGPGEVVIDDVLDIGVGEQVAIGGVELTVVGTSTDTTLLAGIPLAFVETGDAQDIAFRTREVVSVVLATGPVDVVPPGTFALTPDEVADDALSPLESAVSSIDLVRGLLWLVAGVIIGAVVYLSALERQRDFAVLKAIGTSNGTLLASLALQAALVAIVAVALAAGLQAILGPLFPLKIRVPGRAFWQIPLAAVVVALLAGAGGMRKVASSDPAAAFAGAGG